LCISVHKNTVLRNTTLVAAPGHELQMNAVSMALHKALVALYAIS
jgi:hypothetical protein